MSATLQRIGTTEAARFSDDELPADVDVGDLELAACALRPREYMPIELPVVEIPIEGGSGYAGDWPGDRFLAQDDDGRLVEAVRVPHGLWEQAAENGMGC